MYKYSVFSNEKISTGCFDRNEKEIFLGDLIESVYSSLSSLETYLVRGYVCLGKASTRDADGHPLAVFTFPGDPENYSVWIENWQGDLKPFVGENAKKYTEVLEESPPVQKPVIDKDKELGLCIAESAK